MLANFASHLQNFRNAGSGSQGSVRAALDHGAIGYGIGEGNAQLNQIDASALEGRDDSGGPLRRGIARGDIGDQCGAGLLLYFVKQ
jgi:hypothetical protein